MHRRDDPIYIWTLMLRSKIECVRIVFSVASRYSIGEIALRLFQANEYKWRGTLVRSPRSLGAHKSPKNTYASRTSCTIRTRCSAHVRLYMLHLWNFTRMTTNVRCRLYRYICMQYCLPLRRGLIYCAMRFWVVIKRDGWKVGGCKYAGKVILWTICYDVNATTVCWTRDAVGVCFIYLWHILPYITYTANTGYATQFWLNIYFYLYPRLMH